MSIYDQPSELFTLANTTLSTKRRVIDSSFGYFFEDSEGKIIHDSQGLKDQRWGACCIPVPSAIGKVLDSIYKDDCTIDEAAAAIDSGSTYWIEVPLVDVAQFRRGDGSTAGHPTRSFEGLEVASHFLLHNFSRCPKFTFALAFGCERVAVKKSSLVPKDIHQFEFVIDRLREIRRSFRSIVAYFNESTEVAKFLSSRLSSICEVTIRFILCSLLLFTRSEGWCDLYRLKKESLFVQVRDCSGDLSTKLREKCSSQDAEIVSILLFLDNLSFLLKSIENTNSFYETEPMNCFSPPGSLKLDEIRRFPKLMRLGRIQSIIVLLQRLTRGEYFKFFQSVKQLSGYYDEDIQETDLRPKAWASPPLPLTVAQKAVVSSCFSWVRYWAIAGLFTNSIDGRFLIRNGRIPVKELSSLLLFREIAQGSITDESLYADCLSFLRTMNLGENIISVNGTLFLRITKKDGSFCSSRDDIYQHMKTKSVSGNLLLPLPSWFAFRSPVSPQNSSYNPCFIRPLHPHEVISRYYISPLEDLSVSDLVSRRFNLSTDQFVVLEDSARTQLLGSGLDGSLDAMETYIQKRKNICDAILSSSFGKEFLMPLITVPRDSEDAAIVDDNSSCWETDDEATAYRLFYDITEHVDRFFLPLSRHLRLNNPIQKSTQVSLQQHKTQEVKPTNDTGLVLHLSLSRLRSCHSHDKSSFRFPFCPVSETFCFPFSDSNEPDGGYEDTKELPPEAYALREDYLPTEEGHIGPVDLMREGLFTAMDVAELYDRALDCSQVCNRGPSIEPEEDADIILSTEETQDLSLGIHNTDELITRVTESCKSAKFISIDAENLLKKWCDLSKEKEELINVSNSVTSPNSCDNIVEPSESVSEQPTGPAALDPPVHVDYTSSAFTSNKGGVFSKIVQSLNTDELCRAPLVPGKSAEWFTTKRDPEKSFTKEIVGTFSVANLFSLQSNNNKASPLKLISSVPLLEKGSPLALPVRPANNKTNMAAEDVSPMPLQLSDIRKISPKSSPIPFALNSDEDIHYSSTLDQKMATVVIPSNNVSIRGKSFPDPVEEATSTKQVVLTEKKASFSSDGMSNKEGQSASWLPGHPVESTISPQETEKKLLPNIEPSRSLARRDNSFKRFLDYFLPKVEHPYPPMYAIQLAHLCSIRGLFLTTEEGTSENSMVLSKKSSNAVTVMRVLTYELFKSEDLLEYVIDKRKKFFRNMSHYELRQRSINLRTNTANESNVSSPYSPSEQTHTSGPTTPLERQQNPSKAYNDINEASLLSDSLPDVSAIEPINDTLISVIEKDIFDLSEGPCGILLPTSQRRYTAKPTSTKLYDNQVISEIEKASNGDSFCDSGVERFGENTTPVPHPPIQISSSLKKQSNIIDHSLSSLGNKRPRERGIEDSPVTMLFRNQIHTRGTSKESAVEKNHRVQMEKLEAIENELRTVINTCRKRLERYNYVASQYPMTKVLNLVYRPRMVHDIEGPAVQYIAELVQHVVCFGRYIQAADDVHRGYKQSAESLLPITQIIRSLPDEGLPHGYMETYNYISDSENSPYIHLTNCIYDSDEIDSFRASDITSSYIIQECNSTGKHRYNLEHLNLRAVLSMVDLSEIVTMASQWAKGPFSLPVKTLPNAVHSPFIGVFAVDDVDLDLIESQSSSPLLQAVRNIFRMTVNPSYFASAGSCGVFPAPFRSGVCGGAIRGIVLVLNRPVNKNENLKIIAKLEELWKEELRSCVPSRDVQVDENRKFMKRYMFDTCPPVHVAVPSSDIISRGSVNHNKDTVNKGIEELKSNICKSIGIVTQEAIDKLRNI